MGLAATYAQNLAVRKPDVGFCRRRCDHPCRPPAAPFRGSRLLVVRTLHIFDVISGSALRRRVEIAAHRCVREPGATTFIPRLDPRRLICARVVLHMPLLSNNSQSHCFRRSISASPTLQGPEPKGPKCFRVGPNGSSFAAPIDPIRSVTVSFAPLEASSWGAEHRCSASRSYRLSLVRALLMLSGGAALLHVR